MRIRSNFCSAIAGGERRRGGERIGGRERIILDMQRAIGAAGQGLANHLLHARRPGRADHHFAAVLLAKAQGLLERIGVGLVHFVADVLIADPGLVVVQARLPLAGRDLLDTDCDFHDCRVLGT